MFLQRRTSYDNLVSTVQGCVKPIGKTDLYYKLKTSFDVFNRWLNLAMRYRLIEDVGEPTCSKFQITAKGAKFLEKWAELQNFLKEE